MSLFSGIDLDAVGPALAANDVDGWLLFDFHGINPIAKRVIGYAGMATRRLFVWLPKVGTPVALAHRIELQGIEGFPGEVRPYAAWQELHQLLGEVVNGKKLAMETSPDDAVPSLDRVPAGVVSLVERLGGTVVSRPPWCRCLRRGGPWQSWKGTGRRPRLWRTSRGARFRMWWDGLGRHAKRKCSEK